MSAIYDLTNFGQIEISGLYGTFAPLMLTGLLALRVGNVNANMKKAA